MSLFFRNIADLSVTVPADIERSEMSEDEEKDALQQAKWVQKMANDMLQEIKDGEVSYGMGFGNEHLDLIFSHRELSELVWSWTDMVNAGQKKLAAKERKERREWIKAGGHITIAEAYEICGITPTVKVEEPVIMEPIKIGQLLGRIRRN